MTYYINRAQSVDKKIYRMTDISDDYMQKHTYSEMMDFSKGYEI